MLKRRAGVHKSDSIDFDQSDAAFQREPRLAATLLKQSIETVADRTHANTNISNEFRDDCHRDNVPWGKARGMHLLVCLCRIGLPPSAKRVH